MSIKIDLQWNGPYYYSAPSFREILEKHRHPGVYAWFFNGKIHRFGKSETSIADRLLEHYFGRISGTERIYNLSTDPNEKEVSWKPVRHQLSVNVADDSLDNTLKIVFTYEQFLENVVSIGFNYLNKINIFVADTRGFDPICAKMIEEQLIHDHAPQENHTDGVDYKLAVNTPKYDFNLTFNYIIKV